MKRLLARPEVALFVLVLVPYAFFYQGGGWNQNSRFDLVRAIVEQRTFEIDSFTCANPHAADVPGHLNTGDVSCRGPNGRCQAATEPGERTYCDKAPGVSFLAVPAYVVAYLVAGRGPEPPGPGYLAGSSHLVTIWRRVCRRRLRWRWSSSCSAPSGWARHHPQPGWRVPQPTGSTDRWARSQAGQTNLDRRGVHPVLAGRSAKDQVCT